MSGGVEEKSPLRFSFSFTRALIGSSLSSEWRHLLMLPFHGAGSREGREDTSKAAKHRSQPKSRPRPAFRFLILKFKNNDGKYELLRYAMFAAFDVFFAAFA